MTRVRFEHLHDQEHDQAEIEEILTWVFGRATEIEGGVAVRVREPGRNGYPSGYAYYYRTQFAERLQCRWGMTVRLPGDGFVFGEPQVCWHSTEARELNSKNGTEVRVAELLMAHLENGRQTLGRWPIYHVNSWQEAVVHTGAHEVSHLVQQQRGRSQSEIICERFAAAALDTYRTASRV